MEPMHMRNYFDADEDQDSKINSCDSSNEDEWDSPNDRFNKNKDLDGLPR